MPVIVSTVARCSCGTSAEGWAAGVTFEGVGALVPSSFFGSVVAVGFEAALVSAEVEDSAFF